MNIQQGKVELDPANWQKLLDDQFPELAKIAHIDTIPLFFEDSSDLNPSHWIELAAQIEQNYAAYDGFVILHGTDTMAYTASALSFALNNLGKPVIFTGSQVPMSNIRSDARRNLINSIEIATCDIPEVAICFNDHVYRGNRATKLSIGDFDAFGTPNLLPLAEIGLTIDLSKQIISSPGELKNSASFNNDLVILTVHPGMNMDYLNCLDLSKIRAVIIRTFGSGNFPMKGTYSLLPFMRTCAEREVIVAIVSQADYDAVDLSKYPAGRKALETGAISGCDMTLEAASTKMMYLLANFNDINDIKEKFQRSIVGELTE